MIATIKKHVRRPPRLFYVAYLAITIFITMEIALRVFVQADPSFYVAFSDPEPGVDIQFPYGFIRFNHDGYSDDEFETVKARPRVGYFGDSVCHGVGAGHGYRVSEVMEEHYPQFEHMNFTGGLNNNALELNAKVRDWMERFDLDVLVYMMTLDDVKPHGVKLMINRAQGPLRDLLEKLRGRCYVYTYLRQVAKAILVGVAEKSYSRYPEEEIEAYQQTAQRINEMHEYVSGQGGKLILLILPYEMQVSKDAENTYRDLGIEWEGENFINRGPQRQLIKYVDGPIIVDAYYAFVDPDHVERDRAKYKVGECFVYNLGEKLDWTHPDRDGHRMIGDYLAEQNVLPPDDDAGSLADKLDP